MCINIFFETHTKPFTKANILIEKYTKTLFMWRWINNKQILLFFKAVAMYFVCIFGQFVQFQVRFWLISNKCLNIQQYMTQNEYYDFSVMNFDIWNLI